MPIKMKNFLFDSLDAGLNIMIIGEQGMELDYLFQDLIWDFHGKSGTRVLLSSPNNDVNEVPESMLVIKADFEESTTDLMRLALRKNPTYIFCDSMEHFSTDVCQAIELDFSVVAATQSLSAVVESALAKSPHLKSIHVEKFICNKIDLIVRIVGRDFLIGYPWYDVMENHMRFELLLESKGKNLNATSMPLKPSTQEKVDVYANWYLKQANKPS